MWRQKWTKYIKSEKEIKNTEVMSQLAEKYHPNECQAHRMGVINDFHANSMPEKVILLDFFKAPPH